MVGASLAPPCTSFSIANNSSCPIRNKKHPRGFPGIPYDKQLKVDAGNALLDVAIRIVEWLTMAGIPFLREQPSSSYMWSDRKLRLALQRANVSFIKVDQCAFGTRYNKPTGLAISGSQIDLGLLGSPLTCRCSGKHGWCSFSHKKHIWLQGAATTKAQAFPQRLAYAAARALLSPLLVARYQ